MTEQIEGQKPNPYADANTFTIIEPQPPLPDMTIDQLPENLRAIVKEQGWSDLMLVQKKAAPYILDAQDIIVQSKTGSGKTGAFLLPLLQVIEKEHKHPQLLVMLPTRELALQVYEEAVKFGAPLGIKSVAVYGGVAYGPQLDAFKEGVHIVVGTPGRLLDHIMNGNLSLKSVRDLVMDEADEMLGMGFYPDMKRIQSYLPRERCTYMFSATMPVNVKRLANEFMKNPKFLSLCATDVGVSSMEHVYYTMDPHEKDSALLKIIEAENPESAIIFCNTRRDTAYIHQYLSARGLRIGLISGEVGQKERQQVIKDLKDGTVRFLVATDVAARGIDINNLSHVFMYDHPIDSEVYVHRSGRTARAGNSGQAISLVGLVEEMNLKATATKFGMPLIKKALPDEKKLQTIISERASVYLEQAYRNLKQTEKNGAKRMIPLLEDLVQSDDVKAVLGMLLHQFYWKTFTGNEEAERIDAPEAEVVPEDGDTPKQDAAP